ncbi:ArsR/SmtB family transcription factor [Methylobacterium sp. J-068]|uniref:ArsR/SmtB family transcription factor n=1 Tax=Methylobacterium sp. J-068 TaxID=2836649 RepID=UPI001FB97DE0|nr:winged helix-turn-helix domain-containing protein [Methylobacterium sp. J-068]MCJ2033822.1 winged helix-turn-helix domain-containing protein [Methylobacterium sp. J-068]
MSSGPALSEVGALIGDPGRANILSALIDGRALTPTELAWTAGVAPATASEHLTKLVAGGLLAVSRQGRHRYFRLASVEVARMLEAMMVIANRSEPKDAPRRATPRIDPALREARTCYDHLAGRLGVGIADAMVSKGLIVLSEEAGEVTESGIQWLAAFGVEIEPAGRSRRLLCRPCLDWSERRPHLAGRLGAALCARCEALGWIERQRDGRAVRVTDTGRRGFTSEFGLPKSDGLTFVAEEPSMPPRVQD